MSVRWNPCPARGRIWEQSVERDKLGCHRWMKTNNWTNWEETSNRWARTWGSKCVQGSLNSKRCSYSDPLTHLQSESVWCRPRSLRPPSAWGAGLGVWLSQLNTRSLQEKNISTVFYLISPLPVECVTLEAGVREAAEASGWGWVAPAQGLGRLVTPDLLILRRLDSDQWKVEILVTLGLVTLVLRAQ